MAALEKIRKRAVILTLVIGAGLLAFILEEAVRASGAFGRDDLALKVGNEKIDIMEFSKRVQQEQEKQSPDSKVDPALVQQQVAQEYVIDQLLSQECDEANVDVTNGEVTEMLMQNPPQEIANYCQQTGQDPRVVFEQLKKAGPNDQNANIMKKLYEDQAKQITLGLKSQKLFNLVMGCLQANKYELELQEQQLATYDLEMAMVDYNSLAPQYKVSDEELKDAYNKFKEFFKIDNEQRRISYIKVDVDPSAKDTLEANAKIKELYAALQAQEGIKGLRSNSDTHVFIDSMRVRSKKSGNEAIIEEVIAGGKDNIKTQSPKNIHDRNSFIYKVTSVLSCPDSIGFDIVQVSGGKATQDSVLNKLNAGVSIDSIADPKNKNIETHKYDKQNPLTAEQFAAFDDSIRNVIKENLGGAKFFYMNRATEGEQQGAYIVRVADHKGDVNIYTVARVKYVNDPSEATVTGLRTNLQNYLNKNKTVADFKKNAKAAHYNVQEEVIKPETAMLGEQFMYGQRMGGIKDTRKVVKWAYENKPGTISEIYTDDQYMLVVAVEDVYKDYLPYDDPQVKEMLTNYVRNNKIGDDMLKKYNGKYNDVAAYASALNTQVDSLQLVPGSGMINDGKVIGRLIGLGEKAVGKVQVVAGDNGFYVLNVKKVEKPAAKPEKAQAMKEYQNKVINPHMQGLFMNSRKVKNNLVKFS